MKNTNPKCKGCGGQEDPVECMYKILWTDLYGGTSCNALANAGEDVKIEKKGWVEFGNTNT